MNVVLFLHWYCPTAKPLCLKLSSGEPKPLQPWDKYGTFTFTKCVCVCCCFGGTFCKGWCCQSHWTAFWGQRNWVKSGELCDARVHKQTNTWTHTFVPHAGKQEMAECVYKYLHHQQCCGRQCLRVFWSFVLINHTEQERERERERPVEDMLKLTWLAGFYYFKPPPSSMFLFLQFYLLFFPLALPSLTVSLFFSVTSIFAFPFINPDYSLPFLSLSSNPPLVFFPLLSLSPQLSTSFCFFSPPVPSTTDSRYTQA